MNTVIERTGFDPAQDADNGNRFLTGNGYMGVRGTIGEAGVQQMTAGKHGEEGFQNHIVLTDNGTAYLGKHLFCIIQNKIPLFGHRYAYHTIGALSMQEREPKTYQNVTERMQRRKNDRKALAYRLNDVANFVKTTQGKQNANLL